jgi:hypothetical protein
MATTPLETSTAAITRYSSRSPDSKPRNKSDLRTALAVGGGEGRPRNSLPVEWRSRTRPSAHGPSILRGLVSSRFHSTFRRAMHRVSWTGRLLLRKACEHSERSARRPPRHRRLVHSASAEEPQVGWSS